MKRAIPTLALFSLLLAHTASAQAPRPGKPSESPLLAAADDITRQVVALRGLELKRPFAKGVLSRAEIGARLKERIAKEYTPDEVAIESRILKRLGLLPEDVDYQKLLTDLLMEQVAGFYDPFTHQLYLADWISDGLQRPAMAHEIEHALQDQHFDLKGFATPIKDDGDRQLARSALVEGDGTAVMLEFVIQQTGLPLSQLPDAVSAIASQVASGKIDGFQDPSLAKAPRFLRETLTFPYFAGMQFVMALRKGQPWSRIDAVFRDPPESTEQVLHPQKYLARERPVAIAAGAIEALAPAKELRRDVFGEFELRILLAAHLDDATAERAAAGWGGDRVVAYGTPGGAVGLVSLSTWDTQEDAVQAESALRRWMAKRLAQPEAAADQPAVFTVADEGWSVERRGREILMMLGVPAQNRVAAVDEVWRSWKVPETPPRPAGSEVPAAPEKAKKGKGKGKAK